MTLILIVVAAIAVDLGMQRVVRSDLQAVADVVALDTGRQLRGKAVNAYTPAERSAIQTAFEKSLEANDDSLGELEGYDWAFVRRNADTGDWDVLPRWTSAAVPDAVQVTVDGRVDFAFGQVAGIDRGGASRAAVAAKSTPAACVTVGTRVLALDTSSGGLSPLLDHILRVNLKALGYDGIANLEHLTVPLADLLVELDVGTVEKLASTNVSLLSLVVAVADVLEKNGALAQAAVLREVRVGVSDVGLKLADVLALEAPNGLAGLSADLNVLDILTAGIIAANGDRAIEAEVGAPLIPGLASLKVVEPPQVACGVPPVTAHSAQIRLSISPTIDDVVTLGLLDASVDLNVEVGRGTATVTSLECLAPPQATVNVRTAVARVLPPDEGETGQISTSVGLDFLLDIFGPDSRWNLVRRAVEGILDTLGLSRIALGVRVEAGVGETEVTRVVTFPERPAMPDRIVVPEGGVDQTLTLGLGSDAITIESTGVIDILGDAIGDLLGVVTPLVNNLIGVVNGLLTPVVKGLSSLLGLKLGVAEVDVHGHPDCAGVRLVG